MDISKFLSKVVGIYLVIISLVMLINMPQFLANINKLIHDATLMFVCGFFTIIIGILMVVSHNIWQWHWRVIITIIGWLSLVKGVSLLFYPQFIDSVSMHFIQNIPIAYATACLDLVLGLILLYVGYCRIKSTS